MKVLKLGGGILRSTLTIISSWQRASAYIRNHYDTFFIIVISAFGKTTNALEEVVEDWSQGKLSWREKLQIISDFHHAIVNNLFENNNDMRLFVLQKIDRAFDEMRTYLSSVRPSRNEQLYNYAYDFVVSYGEGIASTIGHNYFAAVLGIPNNYVLAKKFILTNKVHRNAEVDIRLTEKNMRENEKDFFQGHTVVVTQGFIGGYHKPGGRSSNETTTLGRESSDLTAVVFAKCYQEHPDDFLRTEIAHFFKDVAGVFSDDPKINPEAILLPDISYDQAIDLPQGRAQIIHRKALLAAREWKIPLRVSPIDNLEVQGTLIH